MGDAVGPSDGLSLLQYLQSNVSLPALHYTEYRLLQISTKFLYNKTSVTTSLSRSAPGIQYLFLAFASFLFRAGVWCSLLSGFTICTR